MITSVRTLNGILIIDLKGTLDLDRQKNFKEELIKNTDQKNAKVVLNISQVDFIDSACLGALVSVARRIRDKGGDIKIAAPNEEVLSVFQITRLDKVFEIHDSVDNASKSY